MKLNLRIWRQNGPRDKGALAAYPLDKLEPDMSFLEMLDVLNEKLLHQGERPVAFDNDCREGICGTCGFMIGGIAHGPLKLTTACQLFLRHFRDGDTVVVEPFRSRAFPVVKDLVVDRGALDRIMQAGGFIAARTGSAPEANAILVDKKSADMAMDAAACIGCGACVAACPNGSAMLFTSAKVAHLALLPQGHPERRLRALRMVDAMDVEGFGSCSNHGECEAVCPKGIRLDVIARLNREYLAASAVAEREPVRKV
ncbi:MAG TPA: succinate dehydrogenase/fumarate reductase iron-sulfur subunit [Thermoanaerobaculia bacterium]|jgi:succinate dehydrogenase / fumarate reductase iron-sulfur subunit|nr:succinate dehydrogenase/fumarate reductase iron-sulfur subunit [Thermoanaerobaculia bacterium]